MKKVTFSKLTNKGYRDNYPGYLFEHSAHPGRQFALGRGSRSRNGDFHQWSHTQWWQLYDLARGVPLTNAIKMTAKTRAKAEEIARARLFMVSPEQIQEKVDKGILAVAEKALKGAW